MSERNGDYCQKCGAPVDPTDEKCPSGHVLAEVGRSFVRSAPAGYEVKANAKATKSNDFEELIDKCGIEVEEDDLLKLLDSKLDIYSKIFFVIIGLYIQAIILLRGIEPIQTSDPLIATSFIIGLLVAMIGLGYSFYMFAREGPFQRQKDILQKFIDARTRLRELKK